MFDQTLIRICLILGSFITAGYILRRVRQAKVQIEDTIFWLLFSAALLILAIFPGIAYWAANLLGFMSPINFVYVVIIFLLLAKQFFMSIKLSQLDSKVRILTEQVALNEEKVERWCGCWAGRARPRTAPPDWTGSRCTLAVSGCSAPCCASLTWTPRCRCAAL